jgi:hypothetical protein
MCVADPGFEGPVTSDCLEISFLIVEDDGKSLSHFTFYSCLLILISIQKTQLLRLSPGLPKPSPLVHMSGHISTITLQVGPLWSTASQMTDMVSVFLSVPLCPRKNVYHLGSGGLRPPGLYRPQPSRQFRNTCWLRSWRRWYVDLCVRLLSLMENIKLIEI